MAEVRERCDTLGRSPERGMRIGPESDNLRRLRFGSYWIIYTVEPDVVMVMRVLHGARDLSVLFGDPD